MTDPTGSLDQINAAINEASFKMSRKLAESLYKRDKPFFDYLSGLDRRKPSRWQRLRWRLQGWVHSFFCCGGCQDD